MKKSAAGSAEQEKLAAGSLHDVGTARPAQGRLEHALEDAIEGLTEGFVLFDADKRFVTCNSRYREMFPSVAHLMVPGTPYATLLAALVQNGDALGIDDVDDHIAKRTSPSRSTYEAEHRLADGRWVRVSDRRTKDGGIVGIRTDITESKQQEAAFRRREEQLSRAQELAQIGDWRVDFATGRFEWSESTSRLLGAGPGAVTPSLDLVLELVHPDDRPVVETALQLLTAGEAIQPRELRTQGFDGNDRIVWIEAHPERDARGTAIAAYGIIQDITERKRRESDLLLAKEEAEKASRAKSQFLASMSHELRTPLNAIIGFSEIIGRELLGPVGVPHYGEYARDIHRSGTHLLALIDDILDMAKVEAGRWQLREDAVDLRGLVEEVARFTQAGQPDASRLVIDFRSQAEVLWADARALRQVLLNLVTNALKFTPEPGLVTLRVHDEPDAVCLGVEDTGVGIPADRIGDLGQPFVQVENVMTRRHFGSGIGLFITRSLAELHGGSLSIASQEGVGTTATVRLPRSRIRSSAMMSGAAGSIPA